MSKKYILAIETLTKSGSLALFSEEMKEIDGYIGSECNKLSVDLIDMIRSLLIRNEIMSSQVSKIIIANGPGSFTGLRVGWSVVRALSKGLSVPFFSVSILDALLEDQGAGKCPDFAFISIGAGKIVCKKSGDNFTKSFSIDGFSEELSIYPNKSFITLKDYNLPTAENVYYASDNISLLLGSAFRKGIITDKALNYPV